MTREPERIASAMAELRRWSDALPEYDVAVGAAEHDARVRDGVRAPELGPPASSRSTWWIAAGAAAIVLAIAGIAGRSEVEPLPVPIASTNAVTMPAAVVPIATPVAPNVATTTAMPIVATTESPVVESPAKPSAPRKKTRAPAADDGDALERELQMVRRMRRSLVSDPRAMLALADEAQREFGTGRFAEERAALRVFALAKSGDPAFGRTAERFLAQYASGPFAARVRQLGGDHVEAPPVETQ